MKRFHNLPPTRRGAAIFLLLLLTAILFVSLLSSRTARESRVIYKGKPLSVWFYGSRTNFFSKKIREEAQTAFQAVGTNGFPFLLSNLSERHGNGGLYFRAYQAM